MTFEDIAWSKAHFEIMADGGTWGIPRSGLIFQRRGQTLVLMATLPHDPGMPIDTAELKRQQDADFEIIKKHFGAAGIEVKR